MILNKEQVDLMDLDTVQKSLKQFHKTFKVEAALTPEVWADIDNISNTLLYLEDREGYLEMTANLVRAQNARWGKE